MNLRKSSKVISIVVCLGVLALPVAHFRWLEKLTAPLQFISRESKTPNGSPVINRIQKFSDGENEIWMMQQSSDSLTSQPDTWDRLAIVVNRQSREATFYQFEPGPLEWPGPGASGLSQTNPKVACFLCHVNGPRAIRPMGHLDILSQFKIFLWNSEIAHLPRLKQKADHAYGRFSFESPFAQTELKISMCSECHNSKPDGRSPLMKQNFLSIRFLTANHFMPPSGRELSASEVAQIEEFLSDTPKQ